MNGIKENLLELKWFCELLLIGSEMKYENMYQSGNKHAICGGHLDTSSVGTERTQYSQILNHPGMRKIGSWTKGWTWRQEELQDVFHNTNSVIKASGYGRPGKGRSQRWLRCFQPEKLTCVAGTHENGEIRCGNPQEKMHNNESWASQNKNLYKFWARVIYYVSLNYKD